MDLIAGLPEDTPAGFARSLDEVISMGADNITVHTLSLKKGSRIMLEGSRIPGAESGIPSRSLKSVRPLLPPNPISLRKNASISA